jgi:N,N'-diacetyllegionaminate synthase
MPMDISAANRESRRSELDMNWFEKFTPGAACTIIAEVGQAHDGSLGTAHAFIDAVARAGAPAIKFQTHIAEAESTPGEPWRRPFSYQDPTRYDYWRRMEFTPEQWHGLKNHAEEKGLVFLSSPFSLDAVELLARLDMKAWKVASGEVSNPVLLDAIAATSRPVLLSSGMSDLSELDAAVARIGRNGVPLAIMQCTSSYPCPPERIGLNALEQFRRRYGKSVGLSDHSGTIYPGLAAATLGAEIVEVHVTLSREMFGPDVGSSITTTELATLVEGARFINCMRANPVDKMQLTSELQDLRKIFMKSIFAKSDLPEGIKLEPGMLSAKKPGGGIPAADLPALCGRRVRRHIRSGSMLQREDLD